ncbi:hypothetical protein SDC9_194338 [bioreactor metagenome]|uniref:Uncharacterized protein n=1 Tax=bioreactor metagenome TaxID=1076179 RepID=A0A645I6L5_9ZZZZ
MSLSGNVGAFLKVTQVVCQVCQDLDGDRQQQRQQQDGGAEAAFMPGQPAAEDDSGDGQKECPQPKGGDPLREGCHLQLLISRPLQK